jgi:gliding motility-associated protein GldC
MSTANQPNLTSTIRLEVELDEARIPQRMHWSSTDGKESEGSECAAFLLSIWDPKAAQALRIDLWTKDMQKDEMNIMFFQTFLTMAETYARANGDAKLTDMIRHFSYDFGETAKIIRRKEEAPLPPLPVPGQG